MSNYWNSCLYPLFLSSLNSCTYVQFTDQELQNELDNFARRAIAKFKFPKVDLSYEYDEEIVDIKKAVIERQAKGYYFINDITMREIIVLVSWMKVF